MLYFASLLRSFKIDFYLCFNRDREEKFLHFTLYKEDCDQAETFNRLTSILAGRNNHSRFSNSSNRTSKYAFKAAGTKGNSYIFIGYMYRIQLRFFLV